MTKHRFIQGLLALTLAGMAGCSRYGSDTVTYPLRGCLFVGGKPAVGASVYLVPEENLDRYPVEAPDYLVGAIVDDNGNFEVMTNGVQKGAPVGTYFLAMNWFDPRVIPDVDDGIRGKDLIPLKYRDARKSGIEIQVEAVDSQTAVIELKLESQSLQANDISLVME